MRRKPDTCPAEASTAKGPDPICHYAWQEIDSIPAGATRQVRAVLGARHARQLCVALLAEITGGDSGSWSISPPGQGRPRVLAADPGMKLPSISLSHSGNSVAAAASWHAVPGIDIQVMDRDRDYAALAAHMGWIPSLGARRTWRRGSRFTRIWTQWESWFKALDTALPDAMESFQEVLAQDLSTSGMQTQAGCFRTLRTRDGWLSVTLGRNQQLQAGAQYRRVSKRRLQTVSG
jgi:phosphopantetheinyl transferase